MAFKHSREASEGATEDPRSLTQDTRFDSSRRALIVDDDPDFCVLLREMLKWRGFEVSIAFSASDALSSMGQVHPEIMLVDIQMPEVDGLELIRRIRSDKSFAKTPIIVITATAIMDMLLESQKAGADFFLTKPVSFLELNRTIDRIM